MNRRRWIRWRNGPRISVRQQVLPFVRRSQVRKRVFKAAILLFTASTVAGILIFSPTGRFGVRWASNRLRWGARAIVGLRPPQAEIEAERSQRRWLNVGRTREALAETAAEGPRIDRLLKATRMEPDSAIIRWGNLDGTVVLSADVFEPDDTGRSYRFVPLTRSVWLIGLTLNRVICQFQIRDTPEAREACAAVKAVIVPESAQTTNSWGCRGLEPDTSAPFRGIVLGDSVIQGVLVGDQQTPPACLERELAERTGLRTSVLNAGVLGYSPEQYYYTLLAFVDRMAPHFVIISLCGNNFGSSYSPESVDESCYWLDQTTQLCRTKGVPYLIVPWPGEDSLLVLRNEAIYPGLVTRKIKLGGKMYFYPLEAFTDEDLRIRLERDREGKPVHHSPLYNRQLMGDNHFSPLGCALWGRVVAQRLCLSLAQEGLLPPPTRSTSTSHITSDDP